SLNDLEFATLNINGQSTEVEAPPDIILVDDDDDFIDDEDDVPHDIADSDDEVLANADDYDEAAIMSAAAVARDHVGTGVGDPPCPLHVRLALVVAEYKKQEWEVRNATREASRMAEGRGIEQHFSKRYSDNKHNLKRDYWDVKPSETHDVEAIRSRPPPNGSKHNLLSSGISFIGVLQDQQSDERHEYPSLISTFYDMYTHDGIWAQEDARLQYEEMIRLRDLGADTPTGARQWDWGGSGSGEGADDHEGEDEDVDGDDDEGH
nr:hypothetical protein [Tanacetum cinerariifolium]GEZ48960.1 hypothetical protein [Tanacetum cinerariifolium]